MTCWKWTCGSRNETTSIWTRSSFCDWWGDSAWVNAMNKSVLQKASYPNERLTVKLTMISTLIQAVLPCRSCLSYIIWLDSAIMHLLYDHPPLLKRPYMETHILVKAEVKSVFFLSLLCLIDKYNKPYRAPPPPPYCCISSKSIGCIGFHLQLSVTFHPFYDLIMVWMKK